MMATKPGDNQRMGGTMKAGLYIHVPFCSSICPYCDFAVTLAGEARRAEWERAVLDEAGFYADRRFDFDTVYFGGGTPSALKSERLALIVDGLHEKLQIDPDASLSIEVNPEDVTRERIRAWEEIGFTSVSVGVQALNDRHLDFLGRRHTVKEARRSVEALLEAGFTTVSLDLIFGLPDQVRSDWEDQLDSAVHLGVHHLSCYQLTIHQGTIFGKRHGAGLLREMGEAPQADLYAVTHDVLGTAGFEAYEVSNFARPGHRSAHNVKYWTGAAYLGLGPGAHSFDGESLRWWNRRKLRLWQREVERGSRPIEAEEHLTAGQRVLESLMLGLRTADGVDLRDLEKRWQVEVILPNTAILGEFEAKGWVSRRRNVVAPTPRGMAVADGLARSFRIEEEG